MSVSPPISMSKIRDISKDKFILEILLEDRVPIHYIINKSQLEDQAGSITLRYIESAVFDPVVEPIWKATVPTREIDNGKKEKYVKKWLNTKINSIPKDWGHSLSFWICSVRVLTLVDISDQDITETKEENVKAESNSKKVVFEDESDDEDKDKDKDKDPVRVAAGKKAAQTRKERYGEDVDDPRSLAGAGHIGGSHGKEEGKGKEKEKE